MATAAPAIASCHCGSGGGAGRAAGFGGSDDNGQNKDNCLHKGDKH
jgi:hypothetical protein